MSNSVSQPKAGRSEMISQMSGAGGSRCRTAGGSFGVEWVGLLRVQTSNGKVVSLRDRKLLLLTDGWSGYIRQLQYRVPFHGSEQDQTLASLPGPELDGLEDLVSDRVSAQSLVSHYSDAYVRADSDD